MPTLASLGSVTFCRTKYKVVVGLKAGASLQAIWICSFSPPPHGCDEKIARKLTTAGGRQPGQGLESNLSHFGDAIDHQLLEQGSGGCHAGRCSCEAETFVGNTIFSMARSCFIAKVIPPGSGRRVFFGGCASASVSSANALASETGGEGWRPWGGGRH